MYNSGNSSKNVTGSAIVDGTVEAADLATAVNNDIADGVAGKATADLALPKAGGAMTGAITTNSTFDGRDVATDGAALDVLDLAINSAANAVAITIDASENVGIGTTSPDAQLDISRSSGGSLRLSSTVAGETAGNTIGKIEFYTADTDGPRVGAYIKTTSQDTFGRLNHLHFAVSRSVNAAATEVMRVTADGLTFNGDTAAANALDDYEEGTWTPTLLGTTTNPTQSYMYQFGYYTKIGDTVHFQLRIYLQGAGITPGSGSVYIAGLPFDIASGAGYGSTAAITASNWQTTNLGAPTQARPIQNTDTINLYVYNNDAGKLMSPTIANAGDCDDHCAVIISGHYRT